MSSVGPGSQQWSEFQNEKHSKKINADYHTAWMSVCQGYYETDILRSSMVYETDYPGECNDFKLSQPMWTGKTEAKTTFCHSVFQTWCCFFPLLKICVFSQSLFLSHNKQCKALLPKKVQMLNSCYYSHYYSSNFELCAFKL